MRTNLLLTHSNYEGFWQTLCSFPKVYERFNSNKSSPRVLPKEDSQAEVEVKGLPASMWIKHKNNKNITILSNFQTKLDCLYSNLQLFVYITISLRYKRKSPHTYLVFLSYSNPVYSNCCFELHMLRDVTTVLFYSICKDWWDVHKPLTHSIRQDWQITN